MNILIIGGVAGGATAAGRIRRNDEKANIIMVERGPYISFANCGLPYHISGTIAERGKLFVTTEDAFEKRYAIDVRSSTEAIAIDRVKKTVRLHDLSSGKEYDESYDRLLLSPGAEPVRPKLPGIDSKRVFVLRNIPDLDRIMAFLKTEQPRRVVVVGGGFIGMEVAENLQERGLSVTLVEGLNQVLAPLDFEMASIVHEHLREKNVTLNLEDKIERFEDKADYTDVHLASGKSLEAEMILLAIGVRPETALARACGLDIGTTGGIKVNEYLQTSDPSIYAVGDAIEVTHAVSKQPVLIPLAGPANRQARIAADNIVFGNSRAYRGTQGTAILKVFDLAVAMTGLNEKQLIASGTKYHATIIHSHSHAGYYPGSMPLSLKLLYAPDGKILGAQAIGAEGADKRIDVIATAIFGGMTVDDLSELELAYAPPYGLAKDPVNIAGNVASNVLSGKHKTINWQALQESAPGSIQLVDVRTSDEFKGGTLEGAQHIDINQLRKRLAELDPQKPTVLFCQIGLRGYLACRILDQNGFADVKNLTGGYKTCVCAANKQSTVN